TLETVNELSVKNQEIINKAETLTENTNNLLSDYQTTLNNIYTDIDDLKNEVEGLDENYQILQELHDREKNIELEITNDKWNETSDYLPFKYKCLLNVTSQDLTKIELLNNLPIIFANYGISLYYNESETTFYLLAINKPLDTINLSFIADCTTISITT
ncbi:MAG: hypothetical protein IJW82_07400, partial [Clostridia bacterium]|nr:hypothetical protein [Clostridia bacterium]